MIKKGDNVIVITGKDKGKKGSVVRAFPKTMKVLVEGVNMKKKNVKPKTRDGKGSVIEKAFPLHVSNVKLAEGKKSAIKSAQKTAKKADK